MGDSGKHVCTLVASPPVLYMSPLASPWLLCLGSLRKLMLPCDWHRSSMQFVRSPKRLRDEQTRQLESGYWYIWHPFSPLKFYWECFVLAVFCFGFVYIPLKVFVNCPYKYDGFVLLGDAIALSNIAVNFLTGRLTEDGKSVVLRPQYIAARYLRYTFFLDLIGALPLQLISLTRDNCVYPTRTTWHILKLFRLRGTSQAWSCLKQQFELSYVRSVSVTLFFMLLLFIHWLTFVHYQVLSFYANLNPNDENLQDWYRRFKVIPNDTDPAMRYMTNLYHVVGLNMGTSGNTVDVVPELIVTSIIAIIGMLVSNYAFTGLIRLVFYHQFENYLYNGRLKELEEYLELREVPKELRQKVHLYVNYKYNGHFFNEDAIMDTINEQIKQEINMFACRKLVVNVPLFRDMPIALINTIIFSLHKVLYMPGETIMQYGKPGNSLYLIASGTVTVMDASMKEIAHLTDGAYFGERALVYPGAPRQATVVALEITEAYKLSHRQLGVCLQPNPRLRRRLEDSVREHAHAPLDLRKDRVFSTRRRRL